MLVLAALAILGLAVFMGRAAAQPTRYDLGECVASPRVEALHPTGLYTTHGPGTFGRDLTGPPPPDQLQGALTIVGEDSWTLSRWITQTTAIGDGCAGNGLPPVAGHGIPPVHGGGLVTVGVWMRTVDVPGYANITLTYWDEHVRFIGSTSSDDLEGTTEWTPMSTHGVTPGGTRYIRIEYRLSGPGALWVGGSTGGPYGWITYPYGPAVNLTPPSVAGLAEVGQLLTADPGTWNGGAASGYRFEWYRCDAAGESCVVVADAGGYDVPNGPDPPDRYTVRPDDVGSTIRVAVELIAERPADFVRSTPTAMVSSAGGTQLAPDPGFEADPGPLYYGHGPSSFS